LPIFANILKYQVPILSSLIFEIKREEKEERRRKEKKRKEKKKKKKNPFWPIKCHDPRRSAGKRQAGQT